VLFTVVTRTRYRSPGGVIQTIAGVIAAIIIIGIVLVLIKANPNNDVVHFIHQIGAFFAKPFADLFPRSNPRQDILINWGIAAIVYLIVGAIIARLARR
jgi:hypothetical protein